jgi:hypothetical protein
VTDVTRVVDGRDSGFPVRGFHPLRRDLPVASRNHVFCNFLVAYSSTCRLPRPRTRNACTLTRARFRLTPFRSPLLRRSHSISFPPGTKIIQFPGLAPIPPIHSEGGDGPSDRRVSPFGYPRVKRLLSAPRGFSQTTASFIAACWQGIPRVPFVS